MRWSYEPEPESLGIRRSWPSSRVVLNIVHDDICLQDPPDLPPILQIAEQLMCLNDWAAPHRASHFLEGRNMDMNHLAPGPHIRVPPLDAVPRGGLIELATKNQFGYSKRYMVLRWLVQGVLGNTLPQLRHFIQAQGADFAVALNALQVGCRTGHGARGTGYSAPRLTTPSLTACL